jgi:hypothetical protein
MSSPKKTMKTIVTALIRRIKVSKKMTVLSPQNQPTYIILRMEDSFRGGLAL